MHLFSHGSMTQTSGLNLFYVILFYFILFYLFYFILFYLFRAAPVAYVGSQARGLIGATAASLCHSHSNARSKLRLQLAPQLMAMPDH